MGIVINIDPTIFRLGPFSLNWYALAIVLGIAAGVFVAAREAKRKGISKDEIYSFALWAVVVGIIGTRLFHVIDKINYYWANPEAIFRFWEGGLAIWGAVAGGVLTAVIYAKVRRLPLGRFFDVCTPGLLTGQIIGRLGCIVNGDAYGGPTGLPWGFIYTHPNALIPEHLQGVPTHPYPVYEMLWNLIILFLLFKVRKLLGKDGLLFFTYVLLYSLGRFFLTFVR